MATEPRYVAMYYIYSINLNNSYFLSEQCTYQFGVISLSTGLRYIGPMSERNDVRLFIFD